jgi:hypothetical protein
MLNYYIINAIDCQEKIAGKFLRTAKSAQKVLDEGGRV